MTEEVYVASDRLRSHQLHVLEMLKYFDEICRKHGISYFLVGGTALGAIRHKGFIPWDDDADVALPRNEFERLEKVMLSESHNSFKFEGSERHSFPFPPFAFISSHQPLDASGEKKAGLDIFPLDGVPNGKFLRFVQEIASNFYHLAVFRRAPRNRRGIAASMVRIALLITPNFVFDLIMHLSKKVMVAWSYEACSHVANIFGMAKYQREIMPKSYLGRATPVEFEGLQFPGPENPEKYLTHLYKDFMKWPPVHQRKPMHGGLA